MTKRSGERGRLGRWVVTEAGVASRSVASHPVALSGVALSGVALSGVALTARAARALIMGVFVAGALACGSESPEASTLAPDAGGSGAPNEAPSMGGEGGSGEAGAGEGGAAGVAFTPGDGGNGGTEGVSASVCSPGQSRACQVDKLCTGTETCAADGSAFGACDCDAVGLVGLAGVVGARCAGDADCPGGATCLEADGNEYLGAGGPAGGYCTFSCQPTPDDCPARDPQSRCVGIGPAGSTYCIRTCLSLDPEPDEGKCLNRTDLVCRSAAADGRVIFNGMRAEAVCTPRCGSDEDCPAGRFCHHQAGICTRGVRAGAEIGARCTSDPECAGAACEDRDAQGVGICTEQCVLGALSGCGFGREPSSRDAACLTPLVAAGRFSEGVGDVGLCRELCDVDSDCVRAAEGWICSPINPGAVEFFGRPGACTPP